LTESDLLEQLGAKALTRAKAGPMAKAEAKAKVAPVPKAVATPSLTPPTAPNTAP